MRGMGIVTKYMKLELYFFNIQSNTLNCTNSMIIKTKIRMSTIRKTITFTEKQDKWIKSRITDGEFTNDSEYLRDLVRRDQAKNAKFSALKAAITEGMESGISNKSVPDIMKEVEERMREDGRL